MSFLITSHSTLTLAKLPQHITREHVLALLHDSDRMIRINPTVTEHHRLPESTANTFFEKEPTTSFLRPNVLDEPVPVFSVTEVASGSEGGSGSWRGGWAKRFVPDSLTYETSMQNKDDGLVCITHAPMGVHSTVTWVIKEEDGGLVLDERGVVTSNRVLMGFIKTTLQESHDKLVSSFVELLEKEWMKTNGARMTV